jgi:uncharacterized membrane protein YbhN (UPF0104 family)
MKLHRNSKIFINYFLGPLLFIWLSWSIYRQISQQPDLENTWKSIRISLEGPLLWNAVAVIALMFVNWGLETFKWKMSIRPVQQVSFFKSMQAVLSGVSFSVTTPNRVGEYLGRLLYMDEGNRLKTISITIVGSISQLLVTLLAGCAGLFILRERIEAEQLIGPLWMNVILWGVLAVLVVVILFYFRLSWIIRRVDRIPGIRRFVYLVEALENFSTGLLLRMLFISFLRFLVFILQYWLLFGLFNVNLDGFQVFWTVSASFLVMAIIPTIAVAELAQRGKVITTIVGLYSSNELGMTFATAGIWLINLIIPAIVGSLLILRVRKFLKPG